MNLRELINDLERCARMAHLGDKTTVVVRRDPETNVGIIGALCAEQTDGENVEILIEESAA